MEAKINEIFTSIQGEGPFVGYKQLFIRFCGCNLYCNYCDTDFAEGKIYSSQFLFDEIVSKYNLETYHSISLTGGEPLLSYKFLKEFLPLIKNKTKIYLETNATLYEEFEQIKNFVDIVAGDIKLPSCCGNDYFDEHKEFLKRCKGINTFAKIVFNKNITNDEINFCTEIGCENDIELILQPEMIKDKMTVNSVFCNDILDKFISIYPKVRLIPQVHKFIDVK